MAKKSKSHAAPKATSKTLTLLTATGARPEAWAICEKLMASQDYGGPVRWVIVDDGAPAQPVTFQRENWSLEVIRPEPFWQPGQNTQARNLSAGLAAIGADEQVVIIEDDDYYASGYLSAVAEWLKGAELVGEGGARYYNVASRLWHDFGTSSPHASLCSTAVKGPALATLRRVLAADDKFIDMRLWRDFRGRKALYPPARVVGIKGMPGRGGIGVGHRMNGQPDPHGEKLAEWLGADTGLYEQKPATTGSPATDGFVRQFSDHAVGTMPRPRSGNAVRPIGFIGRDREANKPAVHVFGSGLATISTRPFVVASIYADNPQDSAHALALGQALEQLNVCFFIAKAEGRESWAGDGALKANYLHNLWKESETPVVWLDIDTPPQLLAGWFASIDADFAVHNHSWESGLQTAGALDLSSSAMWFGKSALAGQLLAQWEQRCQSDGKTPDGTHLASAWFDISARLPLRTVWLPRPWPATQELIQLLTPTGCRPDTFALCTRWMARQTWTGPVRWIIVDDGEVQQPLPTMPANWELVVIRPQPFWREGDRTQPRNFLAGLDAARSDAPVIVIEDDDWYAPDYLEVMAQRLKDHSMVAVGPQRWSNVRLMTCGEYSGLQWPWSSQLAFRPEAIPHVRNITATRENYIDRDTWNEWQGSKHLFRDGRVVGIKGLPGRGGYMSVHHRAEGSTDPELRQLQQWIGADAEVYRDVVSRQPGGPTPPEAAPLARFIVVSIHGDNPEDAAHAKVLAEALGRRNVVYFLAKTNGQSTWTGNSALKAKYINDRWKDSSLPVVWVDIDTPVEALDQFGKCSADFAVHNRAWDGDGPPPAGAMDFASSLIWFGKSASTGQLLDGWERRCTDDAGTDDAVHLTRAWFDVSTRHSLKTTWLPGNPAPLVRAELKPAPRQPAPPRAPMVTTLIPAYKPKYFEQLLLSLASQSFRPSRVIISDDSADRSFRAALKTMPFKSIASGLDIQVIDGPRMGAFPNFLHLMQAWGGATELVHLLLDDDLIYPEFYGMHVAAHATGLFNCTVSRRWTALESGQPVKQLLRPDTITQQMSRLLRIDADLAFSTTVPEVNNWFGEMSNTVFNRQVSGLFTEAHLAQISFHGLWDIGFHLAASISKPIGFINDPLGCFRTNPGQNTQQHGSHQIKAGVIAWVALALGGRRLGMINKEQARRCYAQVHSRLDARYKDATDIAHFRHMIAALLKGEELAEERFIEAWHAYVSPEAGVYPAVREVPAA